ncbi:MAG: RNA-binding S4 domain-containing protein, partial [Ilumatobacteraceae bacterium]
PNSQVVRGRWWPAPPIGQTWAIEATRVDQWLWAVRLYKTRSSAAAACKGGHVTVNGNAAKPASAVRIGDRVAARVADRQRIVEVVRLIDKRVAAPIAAECVVDHSPPAPPREHTPAPLFRRDPGTGRPTKKDRRSLDRFRERGRR